jgi:hypothetical protein
MRRPAGSAIDRANQQHVYIANAMIGGVRQRPAPCAFLKLLQNPQQCMSAMGIFPTPFRPYSSRAFAEHAAKHEASYAQFPKRLATDFR